MDPYTNPEQSSPGSTGTRKRTYDRRVSDSERGVAGKRQMVSRACDACKLRKAKCTGTLPCSYCTKRGVSCLYESKYARGRPPTPLPTPSLPASDSHAASGGPESEAGGLFRGVQSAQEQNQEEGGLAGPHTSEHETETERQPQQAVSRASPVLGVTEIQGQYIEPTSGLAFLHRAWKRLARHRPEQGVPDASLGSNGEYERRQLQDRAGDKLYDEDDVPGSLRGSVFSIPSLATAKDLVGYYHDVCVATYRFLHQPSVVSWLEQVHQNLNSGLPIEHGIGAMKASIVLVVLAVAIFHQGKSGDSTAWATPESGTDEVSSRKSDRLFSAATRLTATATGYPALDSVQAHLIQVLYLLHTSRLNQAWYVFGHAVQIIAALGLHRKRRVHRGRLATEDTPQDYIDNQCRKRSFWVAYILDAYLGVMFGRPRHFHDENIDQDLPDAVNDEDMGKSTTVASRRPDCPLDSLIFHVRIGRIVGRISQSVYAVNNQHDLGDARMLQIVQRVRTDIDTWTASLPTILSAVHPASLVYPFRRQATTMRLARAHAIIHLNRPFLLRQIGQNTNHQTWLQNPPQSDQATSARRAVTDCLTAAREVLGIVDLMAEDGTLFYAFWWTHYVTFCSLAVVYVWEIQRSSLDIDDDNSMVGDPRELSQLAEQCQMHLARATASNSPSRRYSIILEELRQEALKRSGGIVEQPHRQPHQQPEQPHAYQQYPQARQQYLNNLNTEYQQRVSLPVEHVVLSPGGLNGEGTLNIGEDTLQDPPIEVMGQDNGQDNGAPLNAFTWDGWQTIDWLDIDALALGPFSGLAASPDDWVPGTLPIGSSFVP